MNKILASNGGKDWFLLTLQKTSPTVLNNKNEEITLNYISSLLVSDKEIKNNVDMNLVQEELFVYSRTENTNDIKVGQNSANTQTIAKTIYFKRHYAFSLREDYAIIAMENICCIDRGEVINRPPENERK